MSRFFRIFIEIVAGLVGVVVILGALLIWRLSTTPMSSTFLTPYVETAIEKLIPGAQAHIFASALVWDNTSYKIAFRAEDLQITGKDGSPIASVPALDIDISFASLVLGKLMPVGLMIDYPQIKLTRAMDNRFYFGGLAAYGQQNQDIGNTVENVVYDATHAPLMHKLQVTRAVFDIDDEKNKINWSLSVPDIELGREKGSLNGEVKVELRQKDQTSLMGIHYTYNEQMQRHNLDAHFSGINPSFLAGNHVGSLGAIFNLPLTGEIKTEFDNKFNLVAGSVDVHSGAGTINYPSFWDTPHVVKSMNLKAAYDTNDRLFDISEAACDFGGPVVSMTLTGTMPPKPAIPERDIDFGMTIRMDNLPMGDFAAVWPKPFLSDARGWISTHMTKGIFNHAEASFKGMLSWDKLTSMTFSDGSGKITATGATVSYLDGMPPIENVDTLANLDLDHMTIQVKGNLGDLLIQPSTITINGFKKDLQTIDVPLHISGPLPSALKLIDNPPLGYAKMLGIAPESLDGRFDGMVTFDFPIEYDLSFPMIAVKSGATLADISSTKLLPGHAIDQGTGTLDLDKNGFSLKGGAAIDKVPLHVEWKEIFADVKKPAQRQIMISGDITGDQWTHLGVDPLGKTKGTIATVVTMKKEEPGPTTLAGSLDMGNAEMDVDQLNWVKPAGAQAMLNFAATIPEKGLIDVGQIEMHGPKTLVKGTAKLDEKTFEPDTIDLKSLTVGRTDAAVHFSRSGGVNGSELFEITGKSFDVSGVRGGKEPDHTTQQAKEYRVTLDKLYTSDFGHIDNVKGFAVRDGEGWNSISLQGLAQGGPPLDIELTSADEGHRVFSATCDDFGMTLKGLGFTETVTGGKMEITGGSPPDAPHTVEGEVKIGAFEVKNLPALVTLMNATSPFGFVNLIEGKMGFDGLKGKFRWKGDELELKDVRARGSSVGMNIDGKIDMNTGNGNVNGTMAPFSLINRVLNYIPILGDVLTGGENQGFLAVNFKIKGPLDKPDVSVNPISILTPGFIRTLFFSASDDTSNASNVNVAPPPAK